MHCAENWVSPMSDRQGPRPDEILPGLDSSRPLPPVLRSRLEETLLGAGAARDLRPSVAEALTGALAADDDVDDLLAGLDGPRPLPDVISARLERSLARPQSAGRRYRWLAGAAAACLLAAVAGGLTLGGGHHPPKVSSPTAVTVPTTSHPAAGSEATDGSASGPDAGGNNDVAAPAAASGTSRTVVPAAIGARPSIASVTPAGGPRAGGTLVTISGTGFSGLSSVHFGTTATRSYTVVSSNVIRVVAPPHASGPVTVSVTTSAGTSAAEPADRYTYGA